MAMAEILNFVAKPQFKPGYKVVGVMTELDPLSDCHQVRVAFKDKIYEVQGLFTSLEEAHAAGNAKLHELGHIPGHPDSYR